MNLISRFKSEIIWIILLSFFSLLCFLALPAMQKDATIFNILVFFLYLFFTTLLARYSYKTRYKTLSYPIRSVKTLIFIPLVYLYMVGVEVSANSYRWGESGFLYSHLNHHIFNDTLIFLVIFFVAWLVFSNYKIGTPTILASYGLGIIFEAFFAGESGYGIVAGIGSGLLWIWIFHFNWLYTLLLTQNLTKLKEN